MNHVISIIKQQFKSIIIDNSQAFYAQPIQGIDTFYSPRKFFGVPDGGFAYPNKKLEMELEYDESITRFSHLLMRVEFGPEKGFNDFKQNDAKLNNLPIRKMSKLTAKILRSIDYESALIIRNNNFRYLHENLKDSNKLTELLSREELNGALVYPYLNHGNDLLRQHLIKHQVFIAQYWPNVSYWVKEKDAYEVFLQNNLLPLPIDQRYSIKDMEYVVKMLNDFRK
jgi:hypothetical protein